MKTCPKCGFKNETTTPECLKCGVIFAKVEQALANERDALAKEATLNRQIERALSSDAPTDEGLYFLEKEAIRDRESYPFIEFLSNFFLFAAAMVGIFFIVGAIHFWDLLTQLPFFTSQGRFVLMAAIILSDAISVCTLLAISAALTLGRDITNNTRASRECLFKMVR